VEIKNQDNTEKLRLGVIDSGKGGEYISNLLTEKFKVNTLQWKPPYFRSYSNMDLDTLKNQVDLHLDYLHQSQVDLIIIGCMTLSTNLLDYIKSSTNLPVYDLYSNLPEFDIHTLCIATFNSINSNKFKNYLQLPCPNLAKAIEGGYPLLIPGLLRGYETTLKRVHKVNRVILGCSHYSVHKYIFQEYYKNCQIIDPTEYLIDSLYEESYINESRSLVYC